MTHPGLILLLALLSVGLGTKPKQFSNLWAVKVKDSNLHRIEDIAAAAGFIHVGPAGSLPNVHMFRLNCSANGLVSCPHRLQASDHHTFHLSLHGSVEWAQQQTMVSRSKRAFGTPQDPLFVNQWYAQNGTEGTVDVFSAWESGLSGRGVVVSVVDDGLEHTNPELSANYDPLASFDYNDNDNDPMPRYTEDNINEHGTRVAGTVAGGLNEYCGVGMAYNAAIGGIRMLDGDLNDVIEGASLSFNVQYIDIYSMSWGPDDDGQTLDGPGPLTTHAINNGIQRGRNGLGSIFVWAAGNGGSAGDDCNCDGYVNSIYTIAIGSVDREGSSPWYAEPCTALMAVTYSSGSPGTSIVSSDLHGGCTTSFGGTSASAPMFSGALALVLEANPCLTWRDVQHVIVRSSSLVSPSDNSWVMNGVGLHYSPKFGFGMLDALAITSLARNWTNVASQLNISTSVSLSGDLTAPTTRIVELTGCNEDGSSCIDSLEHVTVFVEFKAQTRGYVQLELVSPSHTPSLLLHPRSRDGFQGGLAWQFTTLACWGEDPRGSWYLTISTTNGNWAELVSWTINLYGTSNKTQFDVERISATTKNANDRQDAKQCSVCPINSFRASDGSCWLCDESCEYGCRGPSASSCLSDPPPMFFSGIPSDESTTASFRWIMMIGLVAVVIIALVLLRSPPAQEAEYYGIPDEDGPADNKYVPETVYVEEPAKEVEVPGFTTVDFNAWDEDDDDTEHIVQARQSVSGRISANDEVGGSGRRNDDDVEV